MSFSTFTNAIVVNYFWPRKWRYYWNRCSWSMPKHAGLLRLGQFDKVSDYVSCGTAFKMVLPIISFRTGWSLFNNRRFVLLPAGDDKSRRVDNARYLLLKVPRRSRGRKTTLKIVYVVDSTLLYLDYSTPLTYVHIFSFEAFASSS